VEGLDFCSPLPQEIPKALNEDQRERFLSSRLSTLSKASKKVGVEGVRH